MESKQGILQRVKDEYAQSNSWDEWNDFSGGPHFEKMINTIAESYRIECNKAEALSNEEINSKVCQMLRKIHLSDSEIRTGAFDDSYIISRYPDE